jgi:hypothetical protein
MKFILIIFSVFIVSVPVLAQTIILENNASFWVGGNAIFFAGGNTTLNGAITNNGTIASFSDLDFVLNQDVGNLLFNGDADQTLSGDSLLALNVSVDKSGDLILLSNNLIVQGTLDVQNGVIQSDEEDDLLVTGSSQGADGYVEGKLVGITTGGPLTFPMGINGFPNYLTLSTSDNNVVLRVEIQTPQSTLLPDEETVGIADEVEWFVQTVNGETIDVQLTIDYSGLDLTNFTNGVPIRSNGYEPAIATFFEEDTLYHPLSTASFTTSGDRSSGQIISSDFITIDSAGVNFSVALIPIIVAPNFYVPNSFAPDGVFEENKIFRPYFSGEKVSRISMRVLDSFNKILYSEDLSGDNLDLSQIGWDGSLPSGKPAENGLYYWSMTLEAESETYVRGGSILLLK